MAAATPADPASAVPAASSEASPRADSPGLPAELRQTVLALHASGSAVLRLAHSEIALSAALALRALLLTAVALVCIILAVAVAGALLVALGLSAGLGWPAALALCLLTVVLTALGCLRQARRWLGDCGLARTRARLVALLREATP